MIELPPRRILQVEFETFQTVKDQSSDKLGRQRIVRRGNPFRVFELVLIRIL